MRTQFFKKNFLIAFFVAISFCSNAADYLQIYYGTSSIPVINYGESGAIISGLPPLFPGDEAETSLGKLTLKVKGNNKDSITINEQDVPKELGTVTIPIGN